MPGRLRIEFEGAIYHVMARGNGRRKIVLSDELTEILRRARASTAGLHPDDLAGTDIPAINPIENTAKPLWVWRLLSARASPEYLAFP
jgi:hypothetical protein